MDKFEKSCCIFVAYLRSLYTVHQNNHWTATKGLAFYAHHLLFERIYKTAQENADQAAEEFVGLFGDECMTMEGQAECMNSILTKIKGDDLIANSLRLEEEFLGYAKKFYAVLKTEHKEEMTLGLDDLIMSICKERETAVYLLRRSIAGK